MDSKKKKKKTIRPEQRLSEQKKKKKKWKEPFSRGTHRKARVKNGEKNVVKVKSPRPGA